MDQAAIERLVSAQPHRHSLAQEFYSEPEIYRRDVERIFARSWLYAGHVSEIPNPGDWFLFDLAGESLIIVRSDEETVRALVNVCRHRGSRILAEKSGCSRKLTCPYHGWTYGLDGRLLAAAHMREGFESASISLHSARCEVLDGLIFVNFSRDAAPFEPVRANLAESLSPYRLDQAKVAHRETYAIDANWKLAVENYNECYHCAPSHHAYSKGHSIARPWSQVQDLRDEVLARADECGLSDHEPSRVYLDAESFGADYAVSRYALWKGHVTGSEDGRPVAPLLGDIQDYDGGATDIHIGPVTFGLAYCDHVVIYRFTPKALDRSECDITWLVRGDAEEGRDYDKERLTWLWHVTTLEDKRIIEDNARGVASRFYEPGPLSGMENYLWSFLEWYLETIRAEEENGRREFLKGGGYAQG